ncbi:MAG: DUF1778 domain-containing protein [Rudaea sp.]
MPAREDRIELDCAEPIVLSERDSKRVLELLENPPKPTSALIAAAWRRVVKN